MCVSSLNVSSPHCLNLQGQPFRVNDFCQIYYNFFVLFCSSSSALASSVQLSPGEALVMDLPVPEPVEVRYKARGSADLYGAQICTVTQRSLHCNPEYTPRASLSYPNVTLRDVNVSDSGTYSIRDRKNEEVIHIYTVIVNGTSTSFHTKLNSVKQHHILSVSVN